MKTSSAAKPERPLNEQNSRGRSVSPAPAVRSPAAVSSWAHAGHRIAETKHARSKGVVELRLDRPLGVGRSDRAQPCAAERAARRANPCTPAAANRPAQPCTEGRRQRRRTEPTKISPLHLVCYGLLGELPTRRLIVLESCKRSVGSRHDRNGGSHRRLRAGTYNHHARQSDKSI